MPTVPFLGKPLPEILPVNKQSWFMLCALHESNIAILALSDEKRNPLVMARPKAKMTLLCIRESISFWGHLAYSCITFQESSSLAVTK